MLKYLLSFTTAILYGIATVNAGQSTYTLNDDSGISLTPIFKVYNSNDGLPDVRIRNLFQDSKGFLWVGTMNGLCKFDGYNFVKYYKNNNLSSISGNWAHAICEDKKGNLWFGTEAGLSRFNLQTERFTNYPVNKKQVYSFLSRQINALQADLSTGTLWIGTAEALISFDPQTGSYKTFNQAPFKDIVKIIDGDNDWLWIAAREGIIHFNTRNAQYQLYRIPANPNPYGDKFWSLMLYNKDLYIGTGGDGLMRLPFDSDNGGYKPYEYVNTFKESQTTLKNYQIFDITKSPLGDVWLATEYGLAKIEKIASPDARLTIYRHNAISNKSISSNIVYKVMVDRNAVLWCGTEAGLNKVDLNLLPLQYYTFTNKNFKDRVRGLFSTNGNDVWFGTSNTGVYKYTLVNNTLTKVQAGTPNAYHNNRSLSIINNQVWAGSLAGLTTFSVNNMSGLTQVLQDKAVFAILKDSKANTWIGTNSGVVCVDASGKQINFSQQPAAHRLLQAGFLRAIFEDHACRIWLGFENGKVGYINPVDKKFKAVEFDSKGNKVYGSNFLSIAEYPQNLIWVGSESGLNQITLSGNEPEPVIKQVKTYFESDGLPDKSINGLLADDAGNLWIATIKGLVKFNPQKKQFNNIISGIDFSAVSSCRVSKTQFLFGTDDGFLSFNPLLLSSNTAPPQLHFTELKLFNKTVNVNDTLNNQVILTKPITNTRAITLNYHNNVFTIGFTALHFSNAELNAYAYKMEGFDKEWINVGADNRSATYTNLNPGTYWFKVKAANYTGKWNNNPISLKVIILPPPWKTWWAIVLYIIIFNVLLYVFVKYLLAQSRHRSQLHFEKLEKDQLRKLNQMKVEFFTNVSHEFRTPLSLIVGPVDEMLSSDDLNSPLRQKMQMVYRNCKKLLYLVDELMTFQKMEQGMLKLHKRDVDVVDFIKEICQNFEPLAQKSSVDFSLESELSSFIIDIDPGKMEMAINNLLINAFKFVPAGGKVAVKIAEIASSQVKQQVHIKVNKWIAITVEDNGKGINTEEFKHLFERFFSDTHVKGTGVGLSLTKSLVELHQGVVAAESDPGVKTTFTILLPVKDAYVNQVGLTIPYSVYQPEYDFNSSLAVELADTDQALDIKPDAHKEVLLIVEDNHDVLDYLEQIFADTYEILKAENGKIALSIIQNHEPALILSDVMMPEMDGVELCLNLKQNVANSHIPVILLTAKTDVQHRIEGYQTGADDYIAKPFHPELLKARVNNLIAAQKRLIAKYKSDGVMVPKNITRNPLDEEFLNKVIAAVKANMSNDEFGVEDLGNIVCMSRSHLFRKLKAITGQNPLEVISSIRLKHAAELLLQRKLNVSQISYEVGFKNPSSFTASFKKQFGKTPSEYLNSMIENAN
ncbi:hybrid sensor histidine kinase/response regulator transcription factor [uncultured Mucilaginibacter sp.]|uniref:hybrid sensor histidine kinase/response regulator transcription factor n=1 Tax=uncultured Mucilaginibacter sp. TaxID=797541 RepID=UPI0025F99F95|nr:hybrid sensor histidine kinase/response regulator transcription factor [uncultured Mucilaginibacter sp.]